MIHIGEGADILRFHKLAVAYRAIFEPGGSAPEPIGAWRLHHLAVYFPPPCRERSASTCRKCSDSSLQPHLLQNKIASRDLCKVPSSFLSASQFCGFGVHGMGNWKVPVDAYSR